MTRKFLHILWQVVVISNNILSWQGYALPCLSFALPLPCIILCIIMPHVKKHCCQNTSNNSSRYTIMKKLKNGNQRHKLMGKNLISSCKHLSYSRQNFFAHDFRYPRYILLNGKLKNKVNKSVIAAITQYSQWHTENHCDTPIICSPSFTNKFFTQHQKR